MTDQHPITPPPELLKEWIASYEQHSWDLEIFADLLSCIAARWGADQELEAILEWISGRDWTWTCAQLRAARRPKQPSLNEVALQMLGTIERDAHYLPEITDTIRRALEQLDD